MASCHNYRHHRHVARVLLAAGRVGDDELARVGGEEAVGDVDGDALLALGDQPVDQQREIDALIAHMAVAAVGLQCGQLVVEDQLAVIKQPPDQRGFAVIDRAAGQKTQQGLGGLLVQPEPDIGVGSGKGGCGQSGHQKYPSCFFFSIEPMESLSISRPSRSEVRDACISMMISGSVAAEDSMAPVSG